jgi:NitT/TauT family transport system permease protein
MAVALKSRAVVRREQAFWAWGLRLSSVAALAVAWEWFGTAQAARGGLTLPTFSATMRGLWQLTSGGVIWEPLWLSNQAMLIGFLASLLIGLPLGLAMGRAPKVEGFFDPYLNTMLVTPMAGLIPLFIIALGLELSSRVLVVFVFTFPFIVVNARAGVRNIDPSLFEMAAAFGAGQWQVWRLILLPAALPAIMAGIRIGLARAVHGMVAVELLLMAVGVGRLILKYQADFDPHLLFATVLVVIAEAILFIEVSKRIEQRAVRWSAPIAVD